ncbi:MAG: zinc ribbon domain-containing protein [Planctomycetota bacterium]
MLALIMRRAAWLAITKSMPGSHALALKRSRPCALVARPRVRRELIEIEAAMRNCPHCAKQVQDDASVCPHCQHALAPAGRPGPETRLWSGRPALVSQFGKVSLAALLLVGGVIAVFAFAEGRIAGYLAILLCCS